MDKSFFPYGNKKKEFLIKRTIYLCSYLVRRGVDKIILACNTLSIVALPYVKKYFKTEIIGVIELFKLEDGLFIGTKNTVSKMKKINHNVKYKACPKLISMIEHNRDFKKLIDKYNKSWKKYNHIYLGCTHFIAVKNLIKNSVSQDDLYKKSSH